MNILLVVLYCIFTTLGLILFKYGSNQEFIFMVKNNIFQIKLSIYSIIGLCFYALSFIIYILILPRYNLSYIIPFISAITYISIFLLSIFLLKENVTIISILGVVIVFVGILLINIGCK